jgi:hypothetical protein
MVNQVWASFEHIFVAIDLSMDVILTLSANSVINHVVALRFLGPPSRRFPRYAIHGYAGKPALSDFSLVWPFKL